MIDQSAAPSKPKGPLAVVGSQTSQDEIIFGRAFDKWVITRFLRHLAPYKLRIAIGIFAVLVYTVTQLSIPLIVRATIDHSLAPDVANQEALHSLVTLFFAIVVANYVANHFMETVVGRTAQYLLFNLRRAMYEHLQHVSLSFMDKTEVGRLMSRLQGDVYALQEFLESSIFAVGDIVLLFGIVGVLLWLDPRIGSVNAFSRADSLSGTHRVVADGAESFSLRTRSQQRHECGTRRERPWNSSDPGISPRGR